MNKSLFGTAASAERQARASHPFPPPPPLRCPKLRSSPFLASQGQAGALLSSPVSARWTQPEYSSTELLTMAAFRGLLKTLVVNPISMRKLRHRTGLPLAGP